MKKLLISLMLAATLLASGCASRTDHHILAMDNLTLHLPNSFVDISQNSDSQQIYMFVQDSVYIHGFQESKQTLAQYYDGMCLEDYVRIFTQHNAPDSQSQQTGGLWNITYTSSIDGKSFTFLCVFYETEESFWRIQASCPSEQFQENRQLLWDYIASADQ